MIWDNVITFEKTIAEFCGSKYGVAVDCCTNGIFLTLKYLSKIQDKCKVEVPKFTYISVPMAVHHAGYDVVFTDEVWEGGYRLKPYNVYDYAGLLAKNMHVSGSFSVISFHFKKPISTGRGGMILTDDKCAVDWLMQARYDGRKTYFYNDIITQDVNVMGYHMYMTPEQAVRGLEGFYRLNGKDTITARSSDFKVDLSKLSVFKDAA